MLVVTLVLLLLLLRFKSLLPLTYDTTSFHSLGLLGVFIYTEMNEAKPY